MISELLSPRREAFGVQKQVLCYENGQFGKGKKAIITIRSASLSIPQLISVASKKLRINARRVFNYEGRELDDVALVANGDVLFFSSGEDFVLPNVNKAQEPGSPTTVVKNFELLKQLGEGSFGQVYYAKNAVTQQEAALKFIQKRFTSKFAESVFSEVHMLEKLNHQHIIRLHSVINAPDYMVLVMEYAKGGDLKGHIEGRNCVDEEICCKIFRQILSALRYCHKQRVVHHDLKLQNILLMQPIESSQDVCIKIADFGLSVMYKPGSDTGFKGGSLAYLSPEVFGKSRTEGSARDIWACGIILYALLSGKLPWGRGNSSHIKKQIQRYDGLQDSFFNVFGDVENFRGGSGTAEATSPNSELDPNRNDISSAMRNRSRRINKDGVKDLLNQLLRPNPIDRASLSTLHTHPWLEKFSTHTRPLGRSSPKLWSQKPNQTKASASLKKTMTSPLMKGDHPSATANALELDESSKQESQSKLSKLAERRSWRVNSISTKLRQKSDHNETEITFSPSISAANPLSEPHQFFQIFFPRAD